MRSLEGADVAGCTEEQDAEEAVRWSLCLVLGYFDVSKRSQILRTRSTCSSYISHGDICCIPENRIG